MSVQELRFGITKWIAWGHGLEACQVFNESPADSRGPLRDDRGDYWVSLPALLHRRISSIGQNAFRACSALGMQEDPARFVFCSRFGELDRTLRILRSLSDGEPVSPADFSLSVHNALVGLFSIASKNPQGHTALAAGADTFAYGLTEAIAMLRDGSNRAVLLVYYEEALPQPYEDDTEVSETAVVFAAALEPSTDRRGEIVLTCERLENPNVRRSASAQCRAFIDFLRSGGLELRYTSDRVEWRWQRCV